MEVNKIIHGDCLEVMKTFPDNSIDTVITDPPYGLSNVNILLVLKEWLNGNYDYKPKGKGFMQKEWDAFVPSPAYWIECLRVAKPGATLMCFAGTRAYDLMTISLRIAGWVIFDTISYIYGCLSEDTEVLTLNGWEHYHKDIDSSQVLCYIAEKDEFIFAKPKNKYWYKNKHTAYRTQSDSTDQIVSRNHRCIVEREGMAVFQFAETLQPQESVPFLESLQELPKTIYGWGLNSSIKKSALLKRVYKREYSKGGQETTNKISQRENKSILCKLWARILPKHKALKKSETKLLFLSLFGYCKGSGMEKTRLQGQSNVDCTKRKRINRKDDWRKKLGVERRNYLYETKRFISKSIHQICSMPQRIYSYGTQRWLCYGTPTINGTANQATFNKGRMCASYQSQCGRQQNRKSNAFQNEHRTQKIRTRAKYKTTLATITPIKYEGYMWCLEVPTGAFVARRNGKIFITGNSGFPKAQDIGRGIEKQLNPEKEKKLVATKQGNVATRSKGSTDFVSGFRDESEILSEEAKLWEGYKTFALKPAFEPIICAYKPLDGTYANNALKYGVAGLNIDGARIPTGSNDDKRLGGKGSFKTDKAAKNVYAGGFAGEEVGTSELGRYPSNVILSCDCQGSRHREDCPIFMMDTQSGLTGQAGKTNDKEPSTQVKGLVYGDYRGCSKPSEPKDNFAGASRFFYCAKPSVSERDLGLAMFEPKQITDGSVRSNLETARKYQANSGKRKNTHPTVKPVSLIKYFCMLTRTPTGGIVLDPFAGSGTTGIASLETDRPFILIDNDIESVEIGNARLKPFLEKAKQERLF